MFAKKSTILFGMFVVVIALLALTANSAYAAPIEKFPVTVTQPDGTVLNLFASGDEFYNWLHDAQGYTIIQDPDTGYYVYADLVNRKLAPTKFVAGKADPASAGLRPYLNISPDQKSEIRQAFLDQTKQAAGEISNAPTTGTINNLVVFIRFSGESEFTNATSTYTNMLNDSTAGANSLRNYYREVSYNALTVDSHLYPTPGATVVSYQDGHPRGYYQPWSATNTIGYTGGDSGTERRFREHTLLRDAITYVNGLGQFPSGAAIDGDGDGIVDGLTFIVSGGPTGWSSLLWPHQWSLYTYTVTINGKTVENYSFHLNDFLLTEGTGVLAHEMFHAIGAPDLYHYSGDGLTPVGGWDVMENTANPPQHMGCYMKFQYGHWIGSIPELSAFGTYSLNPLTSSTGNCYKIASPYSTTEYFVVEYRNATGTFESSLPGTGMLVYRINTLVTEGNRNGPPDEVYIYRPGGTPTVDGSVNTANFSSNVGRTAINDSTDPSSFLSNGSAGGLKICNVGASGVTISFDICGGPRFAISGNAGVGGAILSYTDGTPKTSTADGSGLYSFTVPSGWSGTVTPSKIGYTFSPVNRSYTNILADQTGQNYTVTPATIYRIYLPLVLQAAPAPGNFNKTAPVNGATGQSANPTLSWGASSGATSYEYCIDTSNDSTCNTSWISTAASTSVGLSGLTPAASYYWQVRANNVSSTTYADGGTWWSFTIASGPSGPTAGFWQSSGGSTKFYVTPDQITVRNFKILVNLPGCGSYWIYRNIPAGDVSISNNQFSFSGSFYASGTFDSSTAAHGASGLSSFGPICGYYWSGAWSWSATWQNGSQPTPMLAHAVGSGFMEAAPGTAGDYIAIPVK